MKLSGSVHLSGFIMAAPNWRLEVQAEARRLMASQELRFHHTHGSERVTSVNPLNS